MACHGGWSGPGRRGGSPSCFMGAIKRSGEEEARPLSEQSRPLTNERDMRVTSGGFNSSLVSPLFKPVLDRPRQDHLCQSDIDGECF